MIGVKSHNEKAIGAADISREALDRSIQKLAQHDQDSRGSSEDAGAIYAWRRERRDLEDRVEANRAAYAVAERRAQQARLEADRVAAKARNTEMARKAKQAEKRVRAIGEMQAALAAELTRLVEHVEELDTYNHFERGDLPFVPDAEVRVRQRPAHVVPAEYRDEVRWEDASGNRASYFKRDAEGELVPVHDEYTRRIVRVCQREEHPAPAWMPDRFAEAIRLVDAAGEQIWPLC